MDFQRRGNYQRCPPGNDNYSPRRARRRKRGGRNIIFTLKCSGEWVNVKMWLLVQNINCISKKKKSLTIATSIFKQVSVLNFLIQHLIFLQCFTGTDRSGCITREQKSDFSNQEILLSGEQYFVLF